MTFKKSPNLNRKSLAGGRKDQASIKRDSTIISNLYYLASSGVEVLI